MDEYTRFHGAARLWYRSPGMDREQMIALVNTSPVMVARKDREGWLDLFSSNGVVDDPVGAGPNRKGRDRRGGKDGLGRFYDIFIGPNRIDFDVHRDIACGDELARDVSIKTAFANGAVLVVHCYVLFRIVEEGGRLRLESLRAHWNFARSCVDLVKGNGFKGLSAALVQFGSMIRVQGPARVMEYFGVAYRGIRNEGVRKAAALAAALSARKESAPDVGGRSATGEASPNTTDEASPKAPDEVSPKAPDEVSPKAPDEAALARLVEPGATVDFPAGSPPVSWADFLSGPARGIRLELQGLRSGGWFTSGRFRLTGGGPDRGGVVFFEFSPRSRRIVRVRFFWD